MTNPYAQSEVLESPYVDKYSKAIDEVKKIRNEGIITESEAKILLSLIFKKRIDTDIKNKFNFVIRNNNKNSQIFYINYSIKEDKYE